ncbi:MAG: DUF1080 domain-containing protein [Bryobacteraceae bacterium]
MRAFFLILIAAFSLGAAERGFTSLFDGKSLNGWKYEGRGNSEGYFVENGNVIAQKVHGNLFTEKEYANFVLRFEFKFGEDGANNGIGIRSPFVGDAAYQGMEIQILDDSADVYKGKLQPWQVHGSIYNVIPATTGFLKRKDWNYEEITANGSHIVVMLNGHKILDADISKVTDPEILKKHPGLKRTTGHIGLLGHDTRVEFRNMRIKELK